MATLSGIGLLLFVAATTPGPNNLVVMRTSMGVGFVRTLPAVLGAVLGGIVLLAAVIAGAGAVFATWSLARTLILATGSLYLTWLGVRLMLSAREGPADPKLPIGTAALFGFQFINPKGWVMVLTVVAAMPAADAVHTFFDLLPLFLVIPAACLMAWAGLGSVLARPLARPMVRKWTDRVLGSLLAASALLLFV